MRTPTRLLALALALATAACPKDGIRPPGVADLSVAPDSAAVIVGNTLQLVVIAHDSAGVPFLGAPVTWTSSDAAVATVNGTGIVSAAALGTATITATHGTLTATAEIVVTAAPVIGLTPSTVTFNAVANGPDPAPQAVSVTNGGGGALTGLQVSAAVYGAGASGWLSAALDSGTAPAALTLTPSSAGLALGSYSATVDVTAPAAPNSPQTISVSLVVAVGAPAQISIDGGDGQSATVGATVVTPPSALVRDQYNNTVPGVAVTFAVASGGGGVTGGNATTSATGVATVGSWTLGQTAGANSLTATAAGLSGSPLTFTATGTAGAATQIAISAGNGQSATVNTAVATAPAVLVRDQFNNPVAGVAVTFAVASGGGGVTGGSTTTNASGIATVGSWTLGTAAGANALTATSAGLAGSPITFTATGTPGAATQIALSAGNGQSATVNTTVSVAPAVLVRDQFNNPVPGHPVTFAVTGGGGSVAGGSTSTNASGIAQVTSWTLGTASGTNTLTATSGGLAGSPVTFSATGTAGSAAQVSIAAGNGQSALVGTDVPVPPAVLVGDQFNNPVSGVGVTFAVASGGGSITGGGATSNGSGLATIGSWTLGASSGANTLTATAPGLTGSPITFTATGVAGAAANLALDGGDAQTDTAAATLTVPYTVLVTDGSSNPVQGVTVSWAVTGGGSITPSSVSDASGIATATRLLGTTAGPQGATASVGGLNGSPVTFSATATPATATQITASAGDGQSATVNTGVAIAPAVIVRDQFNNAVAGHSVTFTVTGGAGATNPASPATLFTDGNGLAALSSWTLGTTAGSNNLSAAASPALAGSPVVFTATGTPGAANGTQSTVAVSSPITACGASCSTGGGTEAIITVTARDAFGNLITGANVSWGATGSTNTTTSPTGSTDGSGVFNAGRLSSTVAESKTIGATVDGISVTPSASLTVDPAAVSLSNSLVSAGTATITACSASCLAGSTASTITITVRDAFGNAIAGSGVTPSCAVGSTCTFTPTTGSTNASGAFASTFNSTLAQGKTIQAVVTAVGTITQTAGVTVNAAAPAAVTVSNQGFSARVGTGVATRPTYTVRDAFSNLVTGFSVSISSGGGGTPSPTLGTTNGSGQFTLTTWTMGGTATDDAFGRLPNTATLTAGAATGTATDYGFYTWSGDINQLLGSTSPCEGCHSLRRNPNNIVNIAGSCGTYVIPGDAANSFVYLKLFAPPCGSQMPDGGPYYSAATIKIIRAWINNGALDN